MDIFGTEGPYEFQLHGGYFEGHLKVIFDRKGTLRGYVLLVFDITRTKNYIEEIKEMRERMANVPGQGSYPLITLKL